MISGEFNLKLHCLAESNVSTVDQMHVFLKKNTMHSDSPNDDHKAELEQIKGNAQKSFYVCY